jgi:hypothetical protein
MRLRDAGYEGHVIASPELPYAAAAESRGSNRRLQPSS